MPGLADLLTLSRLGAAVLMPLAIVHGGALPVALWVLAVGTDFADGRVARRRGGGTELGTLLDPVADVTFILAALVTGAVLGHVWWLAPAAITLSVGGYALATVRARRRGEGAAAARSRVGHAAGVANYAGVGILASAIAWPGSSASALLPAAWLVIVVVNLGAIAERSLGRELT